MKDPWGGWTPLGSTPDGGFMFIAPLGKGIMGTHPYPTGGLITSPRTGVWYSQGDPTNIPYFDLERDGDYMKPYYTFDSYTNADSLGVPLVSNPLAGKWYIAPLGSDLPKLDTREWQAPWAGVTGSPGVNGEYRVYTSSPSPSSDRKYTLEGIPPGFGYGGSYMLGWESDDGTWRTVFNEVNLATGEIKDAEWVHFALDASLLPATKFSGAYRGWRKWNFEVLDLGKGKRDYVLKGLAYKSPWAPGWNDAQGYQPRRGSSGGFYVVETLDQLVTQDGGGMNEFLTGATVYGTALLAGRLRRGSKGARATRAKAESLILTGDLDVDAMLLEVADKYGMKVFNSLGSGKSLPVGLIAYSEEGAAEPAE